MAVDLYSRSLINRASLVVMDDALVKLTHNRASDRVNRYSLVGLESILIWRRMPWARIIVAGFFFGGGGLALGIAGTEMRDGAPLIVFGVVLLVAGILLCGWYAYCGVTTVRVSWAKRKSDFSGTFRPGKVRKFEQKLLTAVRIAQQINA